MPVRPRQGRALNAAAFAVIVWFFTHAGSACLLGCVVTVLYAPLLAVEMGAMAAFCGYVVWTATQALIAEVRPPLG
jgi:hypothetical protein